METLDALKDVQDLINDVLGEATPQPETRYQEPEPKPTAPEVPLPVATDFWEPPVTNSVTAEPDSPAATSVVEVPTAPTFTNDEFAEIVDIRKFATLVDLSMTAWQAEIKDKRLAAKLAQINNADDRAFKVRKQLMVNDTLKAVQQAQNFARTDHYRMTAPWSTVGVGGGKRTGARILPNTLFEEYIKTLHMHRTDMQKALTKFRDTYTDLVNEARVLLGDEFDPTQYPPAEVAASKFSMTFDFMPIPKGNDYAGLPQQQADALGAALEKRTRDMAENAMRDVWERIRERVVHAQDRLNPNAPPTPSGRKATFQYTMIENLRDLTKTVRHLNITGDARINSVLDMIEQDVLCHSEKALKEESTARNRAYAACTQILKRMAESV